MTTSDPEPDTDGSGRLDDMKITSIHARTKAIGDGARASVEPFDRENLIKLTTASSDGLSYTESHLSAGEARELAEALEAAADVVDAEE